MGVTVTKSNRDPRLLIPSGLKPADVRASRIDAPVRRLSGATMGTGWSLAFVAHETLGTAAVVAALEDAFALVIRQMSGWERSSDLSQFNAAPVGWRDNPPEFAFVLNRALEIAALTDVTGAPCRGGRFRIGVADGAARAAGVAQHQARYGRAPCLAARRGSA